MKVKFANAEVDIWKLRKGVVVAYELGTHTHYAHLHSFYTIYGPNETFVVQIDEWGNISDHIPNNLIWLEPHD